MRAGGLTIGVVSGGAMTERDPATLLRFITTEIWCNRRYDLVDELVAEDFIDNIEAQGLEGVGRSRYLASARAVHDAFSDYHEEAVFVVANGDVAVSYAQVTGTHDGDFMGLPPTGRRVEYNSFGALRFADGLVVERWGIGDVPKMMLQLGVFR
jgi:predicted ester cyclase